MWDILFLTGNGFPWRRKLIISRVPFYPLLVSTWQATPKSANHGSRGPASASTFTSTPTCWKPWWEQVVCIECMVMCVCVFVFLIWGIKRLIWDYVCTGVPPAWCLLPYIMHVENNNTNCHNTPLALTHAYWWRHNFNVCVEYEGTAIWCHNWRVTLVQTFIWLMPQNRIVLCRSKLADTPESHRNNHRTNCRGYGRVSATNTEA